MHIICSKGVIFSTMNTLLMVSLTYANKSKKILNSLGYECSIVHEVQSNGCSYIIQYSAPKDKVVSILKANNIPLR